MASYEPYRLVVCIDIPAVTLEEAYHRLYYTMAGLPKDIEWESTDEAFDQEGELIPPNKVQEARMKFFENKL